MRLTVPEPKIELYKDGFENHDQLNRKPTGDKLSDLVERIDDPLVIALDGSWGSGKSFFLKCWVGEHKNHNAETKTVYFDAFKHDYLDDPLIALTGAIAERFEDLDATATKEKSKKIKKAAWAVGKGAARIGLSAVTFGATEILGNMGDEIAKAVGEEAKTFLNSETGNKESNEYWDMQRSKIAAMEAFRLALIELTMAEAEAEAQSEKPTSRKLVIVIDELDRCRPDYALSLLEIIKHFFNVDGVHFVLGVNLTELENSVKARYGSDINASKYLQKFVSFAVNLSGPKGDPEAVGAQTGYYIYAAEQTSFSAHPLYEAIGTYIRMLNHHMKGGLRDVERIISRAMVTPCNDLTSEAEKQILATFLVLRVTDPQLVEAARFSELTIEKIERIFAVSQRSGQSQPFQNSYWVWSMVYDYQKVLNNKATYRELFEKEPSGNDRSMPREIIAKYLDAFDVSLI